MWVKRLGRSHTPYKQHHQHLSLRLHHVRYITNGQQPSMKHLKTLTIHGAVSRSKKTRVLRMGVLSTRIVDAVLCAAICTRACVQMSVYAHERKWVCGFVFGQCVCVHVHGSVRMRVCCVCVLRVRVAVVVVVVCRCCSCSLPCYVDSRGLQRDAPPRPSDTIQRVRLARTTHGVD